MADIINAGLSRVRLAFSWFVPAHGGRQRFASSIAVDAVHRIGPRIASLRYSVIASLRYSVIASLRYSVIASLRYPVIASRRSETHCCRVILSSLQHSPIVSLLR